MWQWKASGKLLVIRKTTNLPCVRCNGWWMRRWLTSRLNLYKCNCIRRVSVWRLNVNMVTAKTTTNSYVVCSRRIIKFKKWMKHNFTVLWWSASTFMNNITLCGIASYRSLCRSGSTKCDKVRCSPQTESNHKQTRALCAMAKRINLSHVSAIASQTVLHGVPVQHYLFQDVICKVTLFSLLHSVCFTSHRATGTMR